MTLVIDGNIFYRKSIFYGRVVVEGGRVVDVERVTGFSKLLVLPAGIDVHVHLRDFKESYKETIETGTLSALYGGICLVVDQPNTKPPVIDEKLYERRISRAKRTTYVDYALNLGLSKSNFEYVHEMARRTGCFAIGEIFVYEVGYEILERVRKSYDGLMTVHAEDPDIVERDPSRPKEAEIRAVERCSEFGEFYFCHLSTPEALDRARGFVEVTPHHLLFRRGELVWDRVNPPLRYDVMDLWKRLDRIDVLASDHAPHTIEDKMDGAPGFPGVETMYPVMLNLVRKGKIDLNWLIERIAINPARIFGFKGYGGIEVGNYANIAVFDFSNVRRIRVEELHSKCGWTPYEGFEAIFPKALYIRGEKVLEDGEVLVKRGFGRVLRVKDKDHKGVCDEE